MIRVLHITPSMNRGGIETFLMNVYRKIDRNKIQFDFLLNTNENCAYNSEIKNMGGRIFNVTPRKINYFKNKQELNTFFKNHKEYQVVHQHVTSLGNITPIKIAKKSGVENTIVHSHNTSVSGHPINRILHKIDKKLLFKHTDYVLSCSTLAAKWILSNKDFENNNYSKVMNGIEVDKFGYEHMARMRLRDQLNITNELLIGHVGRFSHQKNHKFLIEIFELIAQTESNAKLLLVGEGELKKDIQNLIKQKGLFNKVILIDSTSDIHKIYQAIDIFVFPSHYEGLGMVLIEAQASGLKCLTSDKSVPREVNVTGQVMFLPLEDKNIWVEEIRNLNIDTIRTSEIEKVKNKGYDINKVSKKLEDFYMKILTKKASKIYES